MSSASPARHRSRHAPVVVMGALASLLVLPAITLGTTEPAVSPAVSAGPDVTPVPANAITVYSGRSEALVGPILARFTEVTGIPTVVDYGDTAEKAAQLLEEGAASPADVFFAQDAGALGAVAAAGLLAPIDPAVLGRVPEGYKDAAGTWVGASGRARVAAYSTERLTPDQLPTSIQGFTDPGWKGRIGWAPTNASLIASVTAMRNALGDDATRAWLEGIEANEPVVYPGNAEAVNAIAAGEIDAALVNHYYLWRLRAEAEAAGATFPVENHYYAPGDIGALVNVAGLGVLSSSDQPTEAAALVDFLLSDEAQSYFATSTYEYPLIEGIETAEGLPALADLGAPPIDLNGLADLQGTLDLMREVGVID